MADRLARIGDQDIMTRLPGRHGKGQTDALLRKSGLVELGARNTHHPFLVVMMEVDDNASGGTDAYVVVKAIRDARDVAALPPGTPVMAQWPGKQRSDWFHFTAGDVAEFLQAGMVAVADATPTWAGAGPCLEPFFVKGVCITCDVAAFEHPIPGKTLTTEPSAPQAGRIRCIRPYYMGGFCVTCGEPESEHGGNDAAN